MVNGHEYHKPYTINHVLLLDPAPVLAALNSVHGHFADAVFICELFNGKLAGPAGKGFFDGLDLGSREFQADRPAGLNFFIGELRGAFLLM